MGHTLRRTMYNFHWGGLIEVKEWICLSDEKEEGINMDKLALYFN